MHDGLYLLCSNCLQKSSHPTSTKDPVSCFSLHRHDKMCCKCNSHSCSLHQNVLNSLFDNKNNVVSADVSVSSSLLKADSTDLLWHYRLGHVPFVKMKGIPSIPVNFSPKQPFLCPICPMGRQTKLPFQPSIHRSSVIFELVHVDLWGP